LGLQTTYTDQTAVNGTTYYYKVTALNAVGEGPRSNERSATPPTPASTPGVPTLAPATPGNGSVALSWSAPASDGGAAITSYAIYRGTSSGGESLLDSTTGPVTTYTDSSVVNGTKYFYKVTAINMVGESQPSNEVSATPSLPATVPG